MKNLTATLCLTVAMLLGGVSTSFALPPCQDDDQYLHNCFGTRFNDIGDKYVGEFQFHKQNGQGTYTFGPSSKSAGDKYVGEFRNIKFHGQGTYTFASGSKYVGEFRNDKNHGQGTYTFASGRIKEGVWKNGKFQYARPAAQHRRDLRNEELRQKKAEQRRQKRWERYQAALNKCLFDNVEKVINAYTKQIVEAECRRRIKKYK